MLGAHPTALTTFSRVAVIPRIIQGGSSLCGSNITAVVDEYGAHRADETDESHILDNDNLMMSGGGGGCESIACNLVRLP